MKLFIPSNVYGFTINYNHLTTKNDAAYTPNNEPSSILPENNKKTTISTIFDPKEKVLPVRA